MDMHPTHEPDMEVVRWIPPVGWIRRVSPDTVQHFLALLAATGNKRLSCRTAKINPVTIDAMRKDDPTFSDAYDLALEEAADALEQEARRRAVEGTLRPVFQGGVEVGKVREFSDRLLECMLEARVPAYAKKPAQVSQQTLVIGGGPTPPQGQNLLEWISGLQRAASEVALPSNVVEQASEGEG